MTINVKKSDFRLWMTDVPKEKKLRLINGEDFPRKQLLDGLGILRSPLAKTFGITDEKEIMSRQILLRFLIENPNIRTAISRCYDSSMYCEIPLSGSEFLNYFSDVRNRHWRNVHRLYNALSKKKGKIPNNLVRFLNWIYDHLGLEQFEMKMAQEVRKALSNVSFFEGFINFDMEVYADYGRNRTTAIQCIEAKDIKFYGHQLYASGLGKPGLVKPEWVSHPEGFWENLFSVPTMFIIDICNRARKKKKKRGMSIRKMPESLTKVITSKIKKHLETKLNWKNICEALSGHGISTHNGFSMYVYFSYGRQGLSIRILELKNRERRDDANEPEFEMDDLDYYSNRMTKRIKMARRAYKLALYDAKIQFRNHVLSSEILRQSPQFFGKAVTLDSPEIDVKFRDFALINELQKRDNNAIYNACYEHRKFFYSHFNVLRAASGIATTMVKKSKSLRTSLCYPIFPGKDSPSESIVEVEGIYPLELLVRQEKGRAVLINRLMNLDGEMLALTGANDGGKSVAKLSIGEAIYSAQSGLPLFGKKLVLNIKTMLCLVFIERSKASTSKTLLTKTRNVIEAVKNSGPDERIVVLLDELGSGTQETDGARGAMRVLATLKEYNANVIFSTQITGLAENACERLKAKPLRVNRDHNIEEGIGTGEYGKLMESVGLSEMLVPESSIPGAE